MERITTDMPTVSMVFKNCQSNKCNNRLFM